MSAPSAIVVPERGVDRLGRGRELPLALAPADPALADGTVVRLESRRTGDLGLAVLDRTASCWRVMTGAGEAWPALDAAFLDARLDAAAAWRQTLGVCGEAAAYRLVHGAGDGLPGLAVDVYGHYAVVSAATAALVPMAQALADRLVGRGTRGAVVKHRARGAAAQGQGRAVAVGRAGEAPPERLVVREGPWRFEVHLAAGVNVGLFSDMRLERTRLATLAADRRVLNLFAYTGTLSVAAATGGAASVTSVDLSQGVLAWARDNAALNQVAPERFVTVAEDARRFVEAMRADGRRFELVLVDPPSFSAARDAAFAIDRDYAPLLAAACSVVSRRGLLWVASNTRGFSLAGAVQVAAAAAGRHADVVGSGGLPPDHPTELADLDARYLQTLLLRLD